jgi:hypothetical protein
MSKQRYFSYLMALGLLFVGTEAALANMQLSANTIARARASATKVLFKPPANDRRPLRTVGAGSRGGQCPQDLASTPAPNGVSKPLQLMALVPPSNAELKAAKLTVAELTVAERPTFWMYMPQTSAQQVVLSLKTEDASYHGQWTFPVPTTAGIFSLQVPADAPPLKIGQPYQWAVVLVCGERPNPNDPSIAAWVQRVSPPQTVAPSTALDRASWNGERGLWYDMLTALGQELRAKPSSTDLSGVWADILKAEGLDMVAMEPIQHQ